MLAASINGFFAFLAACYELTLILCFSCFILLLFMANKCLLLLLQSYLLVNVYMCLYVFMLFVPLCFLTLSTG